MVRNIFTIIKHVIIYHSKCYFYKTNFNFKKQISLLPRKGKGEDLLWKKLQKNLLSIYQRIMVCTYSNINLGDSRRFEYFFLYKTNAEFWITESNNLVPEKRRRGRPPTSVSPEKSSKKVLDDSSKDKGLYLF